MTDDASERSLAQRDAATLSFRQLTQAYGIFGAIRLRLFGARSTMEVGDDPRRADQVIALLLQFGAWVAVLLMLYGLSIEGIVDSMHFIGWALAAGAMALVCGGALGALFGLPTAKLADSRRIFTRAITPAATGATPEATASGETTAVSSADAGSGGADTPSDIPYNESTSLEQIADWLTKIIVGLTLTQFPSWESRFENLSHNLSDSLYNSAATIERCLAIVQTSPGDSAAHRASAALCRAHNGGIMPGAIILVTYAVIGVLVGYLWMRRHFITEMVIARRNAENALRAESARRFDLAKAAATARADAAKAQTDFAVAEAARKKSEEDAATARADALKAKAEAETAKANAEQKTAELAASRADLATFRSDLEAKRTGGIAVESSAQRTPATPESLSEIAQNVAVAAPTDSEAQTVASALVDAAIPAYPDDPWRGKMGGRSERDGFQLKGAVKETADPALFEVTLTVEVQTDDLKRLVSGKQAVQFFLHPTFGTEPRSATFAPDGTATLTLFAYGAFTVGALTENGTQLELNLAADPTAPALFLQR